jgi:hypothetical protein
MPQACRAVQAALRLSGLRPLATGLRFSAPRPDDNAGYFSNSEAQRSMPRTMAPETRVLTSWAPSERFRQSYRRDLRNAVAGELDGRFWRGIPRLFSLRRGQQGLYVAAKSAGSFEVRESAGGSPRSCSRPVEKNDNHTRCECWPHPFCDEASG